MADDLTVHGVTNPVTWNVAAQFDGAGVSGEDGMTLELAFTAFREA